MIQSEESISTMKVSTTTREPSHNYLHENEEGDLDIDIDDEDEFDEEEVNKKKKKKKIIKQLIALKHLSNIFACTPNWDSLDDCDIIESFA
jgi:hypothetical protein